MTIGVPEEEDGAMPEEDDVGHGEDAVVGSGEARPKDVGRPDPSTLDAEEEEARGRLAGEGRSGHGAIACLVSEKMTPSAPDVLAALHERVAGGEAAGALDADSGRRAGARGAAGRRWRGRR